MARWSPASCTGRGSDPEQSDPRSKGRRSERARAQGRVKIDRSFIAGLGATGEDRTIVEAVVRLAHELGLGVVAEGVETKAQAALLSAMGCDVAQGFHYAPPLNARAAALYQRAAFSPDVLAEPSPSRTARRSHSVLAPRRSVAAG